MVCQVYFEYTCW